MHAHMRGLAAGVVALLVAAASVGVLPGVGPQSRPAAAAPSDCGCSGPVECVTAGPGSIDGLLECAGEQYAELTRYDREPQTCAEPNRADPGVLAYTGTVQWVLISEHVNAVVREGLGADSGLAYNLVCVPDPHYAAEGAEIAPSIYEVRVFDAITPETLAWLAMDQFFLGLPAPDVETNPQPVTLVNFDTWLGVANIAPGPRTSPTISVPGPQGGSRIEVYAVAEATSIEWDMGDGSPPFTCPLHEQVHPPVCNTYRYQRSTAGEPAETFYGTASIVWLGRYFVNGVMQPDELPVPQETAFEVQVAEAQALNTDGRD
ncbi:MAG: hypothetical protein ACRD2C_27785 [Acidimicrobiales bacterium]